MKLWRSLSMCLVATMLIAAGCGSKPTPAPTKAPERTEAPTGKAPAAKETIKSTLVFGGARNSIVYLPAVLADAAGFFKEEGIEMELKDEKGGAQATQALVSGQTDFAAIAVEHAAKSQAQGVDLVMLVLYARYPGLTLVVDSKLKDKVKSISDLKGLKVGISSPGSSTHKALLSLMNKFNLKAADVELVAVGIDGMPAALESGKIQAAVGVDPYVTQIVSSGKAYSMWDLRTKKDTEALYGGDYPLVGLVTRRDVIQKNPELVQRVVNAVVRGNKFLASNSPENITAKLPVSVKGGDEALYLASLRGNMEVFSPDGLATDKGILNVIDSLKLDKVIPDNVDVKPAKVFDGTFARTVK